MTIGDIFDFCITEGMRADPRTQKQINKQLALVKKAYQKASSAEKKFFDKNRFKNPYSDSQILYGHHTKDIRRIMVGIDIDIGELLLADRLAQAGKKIDLIISHHPKGKALAGLGDVMNLHTDVLTNLGVENCVAELAMKKRIAEVFRKVHSANHDRVVDAAELLGIPLMCCHTPADNHVYSFLQKRVAAKRPKTLQKVIEFLLSLPEYQCAASNQAGPYILIGKPTDAPGRVHIDMTGGAEGSKDLFPRLSQIGIRTQLSMHISEMSFQRMKTEHLNVIVAGHMASDSLGLNLLLDKLERKARIEIIAASGFRRFRR